MARKASPAQLAARAKFAAAARSGKFRRRKRHVTKKQEAARQRMLKKYPPGTYGHRRAKMLYQNPAHKPLSGFQVAALRSGKILFLSGIGLSDNREAASVFGALKTARHVANQVRNVGIKLGISKVAVVTKHDAPVEIKRFLTGGV